MTEHGKRNVGASVFQRLLNLSRERGEDVNALLTQFAVERLLYRISQSSQADRYILKGAMLFRTWTGSLHRPTKDLDLLGVGEPSPDQIAEDFKRILASTPDDTDGMVFDTDSITAEVIREGHAYDGVRIRVNATLNTARTVVQIDVGFGDAITPGPVACEFPTLLDHKPPKIRAYPPETVVAEKLEAICSIGMPNSRLKDYYDLLMLSRKFSFDPEVLKTAIQSTFERRGTPISSETPIGLTDAFADDAQKQTQWAAFIRRSRLTDAPADLHEVLIELRAFLLPPMDLTIDQ